MKQKLKRLKHRIKGGKRFRANSGSSGGGLPPRITNETVAEHREQVLGKARKYIYPLQHSKHRIVIVSVTLFLLAVVGFFSYCTVALYRLNSTNTFLYRVTQVLPFPVARAKGRFVSYENYLFELRHYTHYYQSQQKYDFNNEQGRQQLESYRKQALDKVVNDLYIKEHARAKGISVGDREIDEQLTTLRDQNRLGANEQAFKDALKENFGWSVDDFRRELRQELLMQKVAADLDQATKTRAEKALIELKGGKPFPEVAKKYSDDPSTKESGGEFDFLVDKTNRDLSARTTSQLYLLKPGEISGVLNIGYNLEIVKNLEVIDGKVRGAHILFKFKNIQEFIDQQRTQHKPRILI